MRLRVVFSVVVLFCAMVIGAHVFGQKSALVLEETPIVALPKPRIFKKPVLLAQQQEERVEASKNAMRVMEATTCTTTPKQQEDLKSLGFAPCVTAQISVR